MRKKVLIIAFIIVLVIVFIIIFKYVINNKITPEYINSIEYDMKISIQNNKDNYMPTGVLNTTYYTLINTKANKAYYIEDTYVFGNTSVGQMKGHNYTLEKVNLTGEQVQKLIDIAVNYNKDEEFNIANFVNITYNSNTKSFKYSTAEKLLEEIGLKLKID